MQEVIRRCDLPVKKRGNLSPCGERRTKDEPFEYSVDGKVYLADLCDEHEAKFREALAPFIEISREDKTSNVRAALKGKKAQKFTTADVRTWLRDQGRDVSPTGRLPNEMMDEYRAAHPSLS